MANVAMELLESSLETRLENTFHIKAKLSECADKQRIEIVASLLYAYDQVRQLHEIHPNFKIHCHSFNIQFQSWRTDSVAVVIGNNTRWWSSDGGSDAQDNRTDEDKSANIMADPKDVALLKK